MIDEAIVQAEADAFAKEEQPRSGRRSFLRRASGVGAAVVGWIAFTWADSPSAHAAPGCCSLAFPNGPWCGGSAPSNTFSCPSGSSKRYWSCHTEHFYYTCWECTTGSSCWSGTFKCSNYYVVYVPS